MTVDINKHLLVPKHSKLTGSEKEKLLQKLGVSLKHLPHILTDDPAIAKLKANIGDIIKIERRSKTAGVSIYYRAVIDI